MDSQHKGSRRLTKRREHAPPPVAYLNGKSGNTLKRSQSDASGASYFTVSQQHSGHGLGAPSASTSTSAAPSGLRRSPSLTPVHEQQQFHHHYAGPGSHPASASASPSFAHLPPSSVGAPFNASVLEEALHASAATGPRRPSPPQHSYTYTHDQPSKLKPPTLRQSASFTALARKMDTPPSGTKSPRTNRYSDEGDAAKKRLSGGGKKKGTFSSFMSNLVSSPRRPTISTPTNPMHVTHVSIDNETGEFTVRRPRTHYAAARPVLSTACAVLSLTVPLVVFALTVSRVSPRNGSAC